MDKHYGKNNFVCWWLAAGLVLASPAPAAIIVSGNVGFGGAPCALTITHDIVLTTISGSSPNSGVSMVIQDWTSAPDVFGDAPVFTPGLNVTVNGGPDMVVRAFLYDHFGANIGDVTRTDGLLYFDFPSSRIWAVGDVFTIKAGSYGFSGDPDFDPATAQTFLGEVFLVNLDAERMSVNVAVPEPAAPLLCLLGFSGLLHRRREIEKHSQPPNQPTADHPECVVRAKGHSI